MKSRTLVSIAVALALVVALVPTAALALEEGQASGQFAAENADPTVGAVGIYETDHSTTVTAMTPQTEYAVKVTVTDANTLDDLSTVKVTIFYDSDGDDDPADVPGSGDTQNAAILTCTVDATPTWGIDPTGGGTTWELVEASCVQPTLTDSTGDWWFHFKPGKVATAATDWDAYGVADDGGGNPGALYDGSDYDVNWYGEITVNTGSVDWGSVAPGTDFGDPTKETNISVTYIANGAYDEKVAASSSWTGSPSGTATLNEAGTPGANEFSLKANDADDYGTAVLVKDKDTTGYVVIDDTGTQTDDDGEDVTTNTLWLKLGTPFTDATYSGTIHYQIVSGS